MLLAALSAGTKTKKLDIFIKKNYRHFLTYTISVINVKNNITTASPTNIRRMIVWSPSEEKFTRL
jgi:hypothetical protein